MDGGDIHERVLRLRDVALGSSKSVAVGSSLAGASYEGVVDSLLTLHAECTRAGLAKDRHAAKFLRKCKHAVEITIYILVLKSFFVGCFPRARLLGPPLPDVQTPEGSNSGRL